MRYRIGAYGAERVDEEYDHYDDRIDVNKLNFVVFSIDSVSIESNRIESKRILERLVFEQVPTADHTDYEYSLRGISVNGKTMFDLYDGLLNEEQSYELFEKINQYHDYFYDDEVDFSAETLDFIESTNLVPEFYTAMVVDFKSEKDILDILVTDPAYNGYERFGFLSRINPEELTEENLSSVVDKLVNTNLIEACTISLKPDISIGEFVQIKNDELKSSEEVENKSEVKSTFKPKTP